MKKREIEMSPENERKEMWREKMFEMRANGMKTYSFAEWKRRQPVRLVILNQLLAEKNAKSA